MNPDLEPSRIVALELQINEELGALSGVVGSKSIRRFDRWGTLVAFLSAVFSVLFAVFSLILPFGEIAGFMNKSLIVGSLIVGLLIVMLMPVFMTVRKYYWTDGRRVSFSVSAQSVQLGEQVVRWIDVIRLHPETSGIEQSTLRVECKGQPPLLLLASREAVHWLHRLFEYYHREAHGEDGAVPQTLEAMRKRPQET